MRAIAHNALLFIIVVHLHVLGGRIGDAGGKSAQSQDSLSLFQKNVKVRPAQEEPVQSAVKALPRQAPHPSGRTDAGVFKNDVPGKLSSSWSNPVVLAPMLGLLLIALGPDHIGTLMALSTLTSGIESFKVGFAWGFGHSLGMIMVVPIFLLLRQLSPKKFDMEHWEYLGDYLIGVSMIFIAAYFIAYESRYLVKRKDGTFEIKPCECDCSAKPREADTDSQESDVLCFDCTPEAKCMINCGKVARMKASHECCGSTPAVDGAAVVEERIAEDAPLLQGAQAGDKTAVGATWLNKFAAARDVQGAVLGALQGLCCPVQLVGLGFVGRVGSAASPMMLFLFIVVFVLASSFGSAAITFGWGTLTTSGSGKWLSPQVVYRTSCIATAFLGVLWIVANACGVLEQINFAESKIDARIH